MKLFKIGLISAAMLPVSLAAILSLAYPLRAIAQTIERLPSVWGIVPNVEYIRSERSRDVKLEAAIRQVLEINNNDTEIRYYYNRVNLNGDRRPEVLVYVVGSSVCGTGGCNTLIFQRSGQDYQLVSNISVTRQPIIVTEQKNNGWKSLILFSSGGGVRATYTLMQFDGNKYPDTLSEGTEVPLNSEIKGRAFIADNMEKRRGILLQTPKE